MGKIIDAQLTGNALHLSLKVQRLDAVTAREFKQECEAAWTPAVQTVTVEMAPVAFVDSSGIGSLLSVYKKLPSQSPSVKLRNVKPAVQSVIELLRLHRIFEIEA
jgi:anti-sigma B factor antagonist